MDTSLILIVIAPTWILLGALIGYAVATTRGWSPVGGIIGGMLLGILSPLMLFVDGTTSADRTRVCPKCAERVKVQAVVCRYCGSELVAVEVERGGSDLVADEVEREEPKSNLGPIICAGALLLLLGGIFTTLWTADGPRYIDARTLQTPSESQPPEPQLPWPGYGTDEEEANYVPPRTLTRTEKEALDKWFAKRREERAAQNRAP
jgi:hypothetical protein